jgi:hypothetical protein
MKLIDRIQTYIHFPSFTELAASERVMGRACALVRYYYLFIPVMAFWFMQSWVVPVVVQNYAPLWPLAWAQMLGLTPDATLIAVRLFLIAMALVGVSSYRNRFARVLVFVAIWQAHAFMSSFGQPSHAWYPWLYTSFVLIFLPDEKTLLHERISERTYLLVIWCAQAWMMLMYSMAGFWKFAVAFYQLCLGQVSGFSMLAFPYQLSNWLPVLHHESIFGPFIIAHPWVTWPLYIASHFFQLFALWTMVRPSLQKIWGFELVLFHMAVFMTLGIDFSPFVPLILILFIYSPFEPEGATWKDRLMDLPFVRPVSRALRAYTR